MRYFLFSALVFCGLSAAEVESIQGLAESRRDDLSLSTYLTAHQVEAMSTDEARRENSVEVMNSLGISHVYLEVYRSGKELGEETLAAMRDFYLDAGFGVTGGIATVAGGDFGVQENTDFGWFNYEAEKTRTDLERVMRRAAGVFDRFIVDDFWCTNDTSPMSVEAKGDRDWGEYRRALMTETAQEVIINPAREENPDIHLIVKFPQWYDRFHLFGYDVETFPRIFDEVYVGTETRGQYTQRFGFTQPYEGFINYRWLAGIAGDKIGGAWFDHGDCDAQDFIEQAWQTVLAGAQEIVLFNYGSLEEQHPGHALLKRDFEQLADLAAYVAEHPVTGIPFYKPPHSDAGGDLYLADFVGMLGVSLVPTHTWPATKGTLLLATQAAADPRAGQRALDHIAEGGSLVMTAGFLGNVPEGAVLAERAGLAGPVALGAWQADQVMTGSKATPVSPPLRCAGTIEAQEGVEGLQALRNGEETPFATVRENGDGYIAVWNVHTFSQEDFDRVGERLLTPRPLGLLEAPKEWITVMRYMHTHGLPLMSPTGSRVTMQSLSGTGYFVQNYNNEATDVAMWFENGVHEGVVYEPTEEGGYEGRDLRGDRLRFAMPARSGLWIKRVD